MCVQEITWFYKKSFLCNYCAILELQTDNNVRLMTMNPDMNLNIYKSARTYRCELYACLCFIYFLYSVDVVYIELCV